MKYLNQFLKFNCSGFFMNKKLLVVGIDEWLDFESKKHMGVKIQVVIIEDSTVYKHKDGESGSNVYEKIYIKVPKDVDIPTNSYIELVDATGNIYGDFRNQLSVTASDVKIIQPTTQQTLQSHPQTLRKA